MPSIFIIPIDIFLGESRVVVQPFEIEVEEGQTIQSLKEAISQKVSLGPHARLEADHILMIHSDEQDEPEYFLNDKECSHYNLDNDTIINISHWEGAQPLLNGIPDDSPVDVAELANDLKMGEDVVTPGNL